MADGKIKTAFITGGHPFDPIGMHDFLASMPSVEAYPMEFYNYTSTPDSIGLSKATKFHPDEMRKFFDVLVFYTMMWGREEPKDEGNPWFHGKPATYLNTLGESGQGIVIWHHAMIQARGWKMWDEMVGILPRTFKDNNDTKIRVEIANPNHPITKGLRPFETIDETYKMADTGEGSDVLLTVDSPELSMKTVAYTRQFRNSRILCCQLGHDDVVLGHPTFRTFFDRAIQWCARKI